MSNPVHPVVFVRSALNKSPGNLRPRHNPPPWPGSHGVDSNPGGPFAVFATNADGWAALGLWLLYAHDLMGLRTTRAKIAVFAPPADNNDTESYADEVAGRVGNDADPHNPADRRKLALAIAHVESMTVWTQTDIALGMALCDQRWPAFRDAVIAQGSAAAEANVVRASKSPAQLRDEAEQRATEALNVAALDAARKPT